MNRLRIPLSVLLVCASTTAAEFPLKNGDTWVMAGDSITAQHLHSNYFEAFCFARHPELTFRFRNSGVGGDTIPKVLARFDWDVGAWKPTIVSVELGMNDQGGFPVEKYIENMGVLDARIRSAGARPVYLTASPINNGDTMIKLGGNAKLDKYAVALKAFASGKQAPFADQFHLLIDVWGTNKPREVLANTLPVLRGMANDPKLAGVDHLQAFLAAQASADKPVSMQGDPVHPGPNGQLMMAASLLKELGAEAFVSSAEIAVDGKSVEAKGCRIEDVKVEGGAVSFDRTDERLPFPIPEEAADVLSMFAPIVELSRYTLAVKGLGKDTMYMLTVDGLAVGGPLSGEAWGSGSVNLTVLANKATGKPGAANPIAAQGRAILRAVAAKEGAVGTWRALSRAAAAADAPADAKDKLAVQTKKVEDADALIRAAAKPKKLHFVLTPAK